MVYRRCNFRQGTVRKHTQCVPRVSEAHWPEVDCSGPLELGWPIARATASSQCPPGIPRYT